MDTRPRSPEPPPQPALFPTRWVNDAPACSVCGRQDETLRVVAYPYVFSLVVLSFRRAFGGVWCARDRFPWSVLAGLISATVGWLGIPFGFIWTPITLYRLALGGEQPQGPNVRLLRTLAERKLQQGDARGAARCMEAALEFGDDESLREQLRTLYVTQRAFAPSPRLGLGLRVIATMLGASLVGLMGGMLDYLLTDRLSAILAGEGSLFLVILSWVPMVALGFVGVLVARQLVAWTVAGGRCRSRALAAAVAIASAMAAVYGFATGSAILAYAEIAGAGLLPLSPLGAVEALAAILTRGGMLWILDQLREGSGVIYVILFLACAACNLSACLNAATRAAGWQERLAEVEEVVVGSQVQPHAAGWGAIGMVVAVPLMLFALTPQRSLVDCVEAQYSFVRGMQQYEEGQSGAALIEFERAAQLQPSWALGRYTLGQAYLDAGRAEEAAAEFRAAIDLAPDLSEAYAGLARACAASGRPGEAAQLAREAIERDPSLPGPHKGLGFACMAQEDYAGAITAFQTALALDAGDGESHRELGLAYLQQAAFDDAVQPLQEALRLNPDDPIACLSLAMVYDVRGEDDQAAELYLHFAELQPGYGAPHACLAFIHYENERPDLVEQELQRALDSQDGTASDLYVLAGAYIGMFRLPEAESQLLRAIELSPDPDHYAALASVYSRQDKFDEALAACDAALALDPESGQALAARGDVYTAQGRLDDALADLSQAVAVAPEEVDVRVSLADLYLRLGRVDDAAREAEEAVRLARYSVGGQAALALAYQAQGRADEAIAAAQEAIRLSPRYDTPHYALALCYRDQGRNEDALAELQRYLELYQDRPLARDYKARAEELLVGLQ